MNGLCEDKVYLETYSEVWNSLFQYEKNILKVILNDINCIIEHVGSTSIYGLKAKPIIDIAVGLVEYNTDIDNVKQRLISSQYQFREEHGDVGRMLFIKTVNNVRTHHIHVEEFNGISWHNHIDFKDILTSNPDVRYKYELLKNDLAAKYYNNRKAYTLGKAKFIKNILREYTKS